MEKFLFLTHENTDPYFNIASEEYLLKSRKENFIYLWRNSPAVIVGANQNTLQEVNLAFTESEGVKVVRRLTGGGAVYHDLNNLCYTVIAPYDKSADNYRVFSAPVIAYLKSLGVSAEFSGRNDITANGKKISGNAETVYRDRVLHHGTLLFNTDMSVLTQALKPNKLKMESKGIKSVRSRVENIYELLPEKMNITEFKNGLADFFKESCDEYVLTDEDREEIKKLVEKKYSTYEWNVGKSPKGSTRFDGRFNFGTLSVSMDVVDGVINNAEIFGDFFSKADIKLLAAKLNGRHFTVSEIKNALLTAGDYIVNADGNEIAEKMFF